MDISKKSVKKIRELIVFTAFLVVALWKFNVVLDVLKAIWGIVFPFVLGGAIAFVTNVPMSFLEKKIFGRAKKENKIVEKLARPISLFLTIVFAVGVIVLVMFGVIPQLTRTIGTLMMSIADFIPQMQSWIREFSHNNQEIMKLVDQVQFNPDQAIKWGISLLGNGAGNMMNITMSAVGSIVSGLAAFFVAFSFACYVLFQKETLQVQIRKVFFAFLPKEKADAFLKVCSLTYQTFANFLTGQCLEAVILGCMFVVILSILRMPYALLIGVLIAFTALIPIFGAFIGCAVGSFLIFMVNPKQAKPLPKRRMSCVISNTVRRLSCNARPMRLAWKKIFGLPWSRLKSALNVPKRIAAACSFITKAAGCTAHFSVQAFGISHSLFPIRCCNEESPAGPLHLP